jgi:hypothetical protein
MEIKLVGKIQTKEPEKNKRKPKTTEEKRIQTNRLSGI